jgi:DMSO/TMAO reductase YedYZ heme-binding membrane subunit
MVVVQLPRRPRRWITRAGLGIAAVALADLGLYVYLVVQPNGPLGEEDGPLGSRVFFIGGFIALLALLGIAGAVWRRPTARMLIYGFTAGGGLVLGLLGMDTIGPPLLAVSALSFIALAQMARRSWGPIITGTYAAFVVVLMGIMTTS